jgi:hypothetical protein
MRIIGKGDQAIHIVWVLNGDGTGRWSLGFSPEADILAADAKIQEWIVAGRCREVRIVVDGPIRKRASEVTVSIDSPDGRRFTVAVFE